MKLLILSDLHLEFAPFSVGQQVLEEADVVVLAGDIHIGVRGVTWARAAFGDKPIIYVAGNHEFYGGHWTKTLETLKRVGRDNGVHVLENDSAVIDGVRFLGCTLWTDFEVDGSERRDESMANAERYLADYKAIRAGEPSATPKGGRRQLLRAPQTLTRHQESRAWLQRELGQRAPATTVVVTHHAPHHLSVSPRFVGHSLNPAFVSKLPSRLLTRAGLWIHGHTHSSAYYFIHHARGATRVVCNPRGYPGIDGASENKDFDPQLVLDC